MKIVLNNKDEYEIVNANYRETLMNNVKTYTVTIKENEIGTLINDITEGDFIIVDGDNELTISNMKKVTSYIVNVANGTIQLFLEEISNVETKLSEIENLKSQVAYQESAFNDLLINIIPEMMIDLIEGGTNG